MSGHVLADTFPAAKHRAVTLIAAEDMLGGDRDRLWSTWMRATQLLPP